MCPVYHPLKTPPSSHITDGLRASSRSETGSTHRDPGTPARGSARRSLRSHQDGATYRGGAGSVKPVPTGPRQLEPTGKVGKSMPLYPSLSSPARSRSLSAGGRSPVPRATGNNFIHHRNGRLVTRIEDSDMSMLRLRLRELNNVAEMVERTAHKMREISSDLLDISKVLKEGHLTAMVEADMNGVP